MKATTTNKLEKKLLILNGHNIVVKNKAAEICAKYLKKGDKVYVEGKLKTRKWKGDDGVQRYSTEVHVSEFNFLSNKNDVSSPAVNEPPMNLPTTTQDSMASSDNTDDLPF